MKTVGIMTGNSLDAVDVVLTEFWRGKIRDIDSISVLYPVDLREKFLRLRQRIKNRELAEDLEKDVTFKQVVREYTTFVADAVNKLLEFHEKSEIAAIGFHGQTLDHFPPSIAGKEKAYTLQVGDALLLANLTGLSVVYDFRSDDMFNGGEGAPLAPMHNYHIAQSLKKKGIFPVAFCNAGNTGNVAIVSSMTHPNPPLKGREYRENSLKGGGYRENSLKGREDKENSLKSREYREMEVLGWDVGPFNHFADWLVRKYKNEACDFDSKYGSQGVVIEELLERLFDGVAKTSKGDNFYLVPPPKSSDPSWYEMVDYSGYSFYDVLRTTEYLSTYSFVFNLKYVPKHIEMPHYFLLFGGGWKNPLCVRDFEKILNGEGIILEKHKEVFTKIYKRFRKAPEVGWSDQYGFNGEFMEARIFADMARCKIKRIPFTSPEITNCKSPTICGILARPKGSAKRHHIVSRAWKKRYENE